MKRMAAMLILILLLLGGWWAAFGGRKEAERETRVTLPDAVPAETEAARGEPWRAFIERELEAYGRDVRARGVAREITPELFEALIEVESSNDPNATSSHGAIGLTQVMPKWHLKCLMDAGIIADEGDLYDAEKNIRAGLFVLMNYAGWSKTLTEALCRYNAGRICPAGELYAKKVLTRREINRAKAGRRE